MSTAGGSTHGAVDAVDVQPTLRVMRLYKPRLATRPVPPTCAQASALLDGGKHHHHLNLGPAKESDFALDNSLKLPDSFGNIYLGETFAAYISVLNHLPKTLAQVAVSAKLQSPNDKVELADRRMERGATSQPANPAPELQSSQNLDMIVEHRLRELGTHTLRVSVSYHDPTSPDRGQEPRFVRKFYRFNVLNPINLTTTCLPVNGHPLVEVCMRNTTQMDLVLTSQEFIPEEGFSAELIGPPPGPPTGASGGAPSALDCFDRRILLCPDDSYQVGFRIRHQGGQPFKPEANKLGQVEICWRTTFGESGQVLSNPIVYAVTSRRDVEVQVQGLPASLGLGRVAGCVAKVSNHTERSMHLQLQFRTEGMVGVYVHGHSFRDLGEVPPRTSRQCPVQLVPLVAGLHELRGCSVVDMQTAQEFPQDKLCDVLVAG